MNDLLNLFCLKKLSEPPHKFGLDIENRMAAIKEGNDEVKRRGKKDRFIANILRVLEADQGLA